MCERRADVRGLGDQLGSTWRHRSGGQGAKEEGLRAAAGMQEVVSQRREPRCHEWMPPHPSCRIKQRQPWLRFEGEKDDEVCTMSSPFGEVWVEDEREKGERQKGRSAEGEVCRRGGLQEGPRGPVGDTHQRGAAPAG